MSTCPARTFPPQAPRHAPALAAVAAALVLTAILPVAAQADITGHPRIVDGDTLAFGRARVRIFGIDAPEAAQTCLDRQSLPYACGTAATQAMRAIIADHDLDCRERDIDRYGRTVAQCFAGSLDIGRELVREGWAVAFRRYSRLYDPDEAEARAADRGIWSGRFQWPWDWRREHRAQQRTR